MTTQTPPALRGSTEAGSTEAGSTGARDTEALDRALAHLVSDGRLSDELSHLVHDEYAKERVLVAGPEPLVPRRRAAWTSRLVEVGAYLGAALVAAGGALVVAERWDAFGRTGQLALFAVLTAVLGIAGIVVARVRRGPHVEPQQAAVMRRLASTLLTLAAAAASGLVVVAVAPPEGDMSDTRGGLMLLSVSLVAAAVLVGARLVVPSAVAELALFGALALAPMGVILLAGWSGSQTPVVLGYLAFGVAYAALAGLTRMLSVRTLGVVLGLASAWVFAIGPDPVNQLALGLLAAGCFTAYLVRPHWPTVTVAVLAAIALTFSLVGGRLGGALAMLVAGTLLLVVAAAVLVTQRARAGRAGRRRTG